MILVRVYDLDGNFVDLGTIEGVINISTEYGYYPTLEILTLSGMRLTWSQCCISPVNKELEWKPDEKSR